MLRDWEEYKGFARFIPPSAFAQEYLFFSDGFGGIEDSAFHIKRENFNNGLIMVVLSGVLHVRQYGRHLILREGQGVFLHLEPPHEYYSDQQNVCRILWMHVNGKGYPVYRSGLEHFTSLPAVFESSRAEEILSSCIDAAIDRREHLELVISETIYSLLLEIMRQHMHVPEGISTLPGEVFVNRVDSFIAEHICEPITLEQLAQSVNMSKYHFCRRFREEAGITPMQYVTRKKLDASKYFLQYTKHSVQMIAERFSFTDQSHYAKLFKRYTGLSPRAYRNKGQS